MPEAKPDCPQSETRPDKSPLGLLSLMALLLFSGSWINLQQLDASLFYSLNAWLNRLPQLLWINLTNLGATLSGAALLCLLLPRRPQLILHLLFTGILCTLLVYFLKQGLAVTRPHLLLEPGSFYFISTEITSGARPSGHTTTAFFIAGSVWALSHNRAVSAAVLLLAALIALSRIAIGVHWPLDLIWGAMIGLGAGYSGSRWFSAYPPLKSFRITALLLCSALLLYFVQTPLPYTGQNLPGYLLLFTALLLSLIRLLQYLRKPQH